MNVKAHDYDANSWPMWAECHGRKRAPGVWDGGSFNPSPDEITTRCRIMHWLQNLPFEAEIDSTMRRRFVSSVMTHDCPEVGTIVELLCEGLTPTEVYWIVEPFLEDVRW